MHSIMGIVAALVCCSTYLYGQASRVTHLNVSPERIAHHVWKVENGLTILWAGTTADRDTDQIDIFDNEGRLLAKANVLRPATEAGSVSVWDVSARRDQMIAVGAVYRSRSPIKTQATLVTFDFSGRLLAAFTLPPPRQIFRLELDDNLNIWTITHHSGDNDPSQSPMVVEYDSSGNVVRTMLPRSTFPEHAKDIVQEPMTGTAANGYESGTFWFWLPISTQLVTIDTANAKATITKTGVPPDAVPVKIVRLASGNLFGEFHPKATATKMNYAWSLATNSWSRVHTGCDQYRLIGADTQLTFMAPGSNTACTADAP